MNRLTTFILVIACGVASSAQSPVIRAKLVPDHGIIVGQTVHLVVEILVPNYFTGSPDLPTFELDNAIVVLSEDTPQHLNDRINGQSYAGIRRTYLIYPQQPGDFRLPPAQLTVPYAGVPPKTTVAHPALPSLAFHADIPIAAHGLSYFLPTTRLTIQQQWSSSLNNLRVGDTVERTVTVTSEKMQGMLIPPLPLNAPSGIRIYLAEPRVQDQKTDRGEFVFGRRIQSAKYFIQKEGEYTLPAIELKWWNLGSNRLVTATLPAVHFTAVPNPGYSAELPPEPEAVGMIQPQVASPKGRYRLIAIVVLWTLTALLLLWMACRYCPRLAHTLRLIRERRNRSEGAYFRKLIHACRHNDAHQAYRWLLRWLGHSESKRQMDLFLQQTNDEELSKQVDALTRALFTETPKESWNGRSMAARLQQHRHANASQVRPRSYLPSLNP